MDSKFPEQSKTIQTDFVLPADTNSLNNLFGGELLARMDKVASIAAIKHSEQIVVTASINNVAFPDRILSGSIDNIKIVQPGVGYTVGTPLTFDNADTGGTNAYAIVNQINGQPVSRISTIFNKFEKFIF